ncbi:MAG: ECF transporter S component [Solirubrobacterales bacterium]
MSWTVASALLLGVGLAAGFAWYERSRPSAQTVALVASMAALAVAGRLALAPFPNVVATTDIVLICGWALGAGPGFMVGSLAALISNLFLGQGPWTPWQMAAWGLIGVAGAGLAHLLGRSPSRWTLAAVGAAAGLLFGAFMNLSLVTVGGSEAASAQLAVLQARSLPFDLAHAVGNAAFALLAGPALLSILQRFRARFEVRWRAKEEQDRASPTLPWGSY